MTDENRTLKDAFYKSNHWVNQGLKSRSDSQGENLLTNAKWTDESRDFSATCEDADLMEDYTDSEISFEDVTDNVFGMDTITDKEVAMDKVTDKEMPMDKVTDKEVAMDKVTDKEVAMDKVTDKEMPIDKVTDKEVAMDKVTDKEVAMEVLSDKEFSFDFVLDNFDKENVEKFLSLDDTKLMAVGKFVQGGAFIDSTGLSSENVTDIDTLTDSNDRMEEVTDSERGMDAATESELAIDVVTDKEVAMDKLTDKEMPMDKVISKEQARTIFFKSEFTDKSWQKDTPYIAYENHAIIDTDGPEFGFNLDLTGISELEFEAFNDTSFDQLGVSVDGNQLLDTDSSSRDDYDTFNVDVSSYSGVVEVLFTHDGTDDRGGTVEFGNEHGGKLCIRNNRSGEDRQTHYTNIRLIEG